jgi:diguanylate cyclase (GGDEF)-like protein
MTGSWLCRDDMDRERLLDMEEHLRPMRAITMVLIVGTVLATAGFVSMQILVTAVVGVALAAGFFVIADKRAARSERPEYLMFAAWAGAELVIALCVIITGGPESPGVAWLAIPIVTLSSRFSMRGVVAGVGIALALLVVSTMAVDPAAVIADPTLLSAPAVVIVSVAILSLALMRSDVHHRGAAIIDPLTGMLNRKALSSRADELQEQSRITGQPVGLIIGDLDRFKLINDSLGHEAGDSVLKEVAYLLRKRLRAFDLAYRIGGEEFLVLLPGASIEEARQMAEDLRDAVEEDQLGVAPDLTMSFGVSASANGTRFDYQEAFRAADAALYEAKGDGRNVVCAHPAPGVEDERSATPTPVAGTVA